MRAEHLEIHVEEPSMEAFLRALLPGLLGDRTTFKVYPYQCKQDLLGKLQSRLLGYAKWLPESWRIVIVLDCDDDNCDDLKQKMEHAASTAKLPTRAARAARAWRVVNRIAIEELEAWYFGDWDAVREVYPRVPNTIPQKAPYRDPDKIQGGTWEAFERVLQRAGYFKSGLRKTEIARSLGARMNPDRNRSHSFKVFRCALLEAVA
jgi:Domain of unknown function (DUF4276)